MNITFKRATRAAVKAVPGQPGYEVDALGNIYSSLSGERRRLHAGLAGNGYLTVSLRGKTFAVHTLMRMAFMPSRPGLVVNHKDGNKLNNRLSNLELITTGENNLHAWKSGLQRTNGLRGESVATSKLTERQARGVLAALASGKSCASIASELGVCRTTIAQIKNRKTWKHL